MGGGWGFSGGWFGRGWAWGRVYYRKSSTMDSVHNLSPNDNVLGLGRPLKKKLTEISNGTIKKFKKSDLNHKNLI